MSRSAAACFVLLLSPSYGGAHAQTATAEATQAPRSEEPAGLEPDAQLERAEPLIERAEALYAAEDYGAALAEFERAYGMLGGHPRRFWALFNIALCEQRLFRYDRAMRSLQRYLDEGPNAPDRAEVERAIAILGDLLGTLRIEVNTPAEVWVDDRLVGEAPGDLLVPSGAHSIELRAPGHESEKREINLAARDSRTLRFALRPIGGRGLSPTYFWLTSGAAVIAAGVGVVFGLHAISENDDIEQREAHERERLKLLEDDGDAAGRAALTADILFGSAGMLAASSVVLYFLTDWEGEPESAPIAIGVGPERSVIELRGRL